MSKVILSCRKLSKSFALSAKTSAKKLDILKGVDLDILEGEQVAIYWFFRFWKNHFIK